MNGPSHVGPKQALLAEDTDIEDGDSSDEEYDTKEYPMLNKMLSLNSKSHPPFDILKELPLRPEFPNPSPRYGDPKIKEDFNHYIIDGKTYPPLRLLKQKANVMMKRRPEMFQIDVAKEVYEPEDNQGLNIQKVLPDTSNRKNTRREIANFGSKRQTY